MIDVGLAAVPNQALSVQLDDRAYTVGIHAANGAYAATVTRDGEAVVTGQRITPGTPLLPYRYQESGNFLLTVENDALPDYTQFGVTQFLVYLTADELAAYRGT